VGSGSRAGAAEGASAGSDLLSRMAAWQQPPQLLTLTDAKSRSPEMMGIRLLTAEVAEDCRRCASSRQTCTVPEADAAHSHVPLCSAPGVGWGGGGVKGMAECCGGGGGEGGGGRGHRGGSVVRSVVRSVAG
jgi:hypothetical protein